MKCDKVIHCHREIERSSMLSPFNILMSSGIIYYSIYEPDDIFIVDDYSSYYKYLEEARVTGSIENEFDFRGGKHEV